MATDAGWTGYERQIGTTGVTIDPDLYVALGVSGAAQHTGGLGSPRHVVSVNTDPSCPMTAMADLGLVTDAARTAGRAGPPARRRRPHRGRCRGRTCLRSWSSTPWWWGPDRPGASAALALARAGRSVVLVERGPFPGSKNVYGGVVYGRVLDDIVPGWWEEVPVERWVVRRSTMMMTGTQSLSVDYRTDAWGAAPYNGMTTLRCHFDAWLAGKATGAGARLVTSTVATGLVRDGTGPGGRGPHRP